MTRASQPVFHHGLRKHAGGAATNTHATGGDDALTPANLGAIVAPLHKSLRSQVTGITNTENPPTTVVATLSPAAGKVLMVLAIKAKVTRVVSGGSTADTNGRIRLTYSDATTATSPSGTSVATPAIQIPVWRDRAAEAAWATQGATEDLDDLDDLNTAFTPNGKVCTKVEFLASKTNVIGTAATGTIDCMVAAVEL